MSADQTFDYETMAQEAMRGLVRAVMQRVLRDGLPGKHHFYIAFNTKADGVSISERLKEKYPDEMTIVMQHRFWDLHVSEERFEIKLTFDSIPERLVVPFAAIKVFFDPSVPYGLQFDEPELDGDAKRLGNGQDADHYEPGLSLVGSIGQADSDQEARGNPPRRSRNSNDLVASADHGKSATGPTKRKPSPRKSGSKRKTLTTIGAAEPSLNGQTRENDELDNLSAQQEKSAPKKKRKIGTKPKLSTDPDADQQKTAEKSTATKKRSNLRSVPTIKATAGSKTDRNQDMVEAELNAQDEADDDDEHDKSTQPSLVETDGRANVVSLDAFRKK